MNTCRDGVRISGFTAGLRLLVLLLAATLVACGSSGSSSRGAAPGGGGDDSDSVCLEASCIEELVVTVFPNAVDLVFTEAGRLFVSAGQQVYEILREGENVVNEAIADTECSFGGLASQGGYLYAVCRDGRIYGALLDDDTPVLSEIYDTGNMCRPQGVALGPDGHLYVVDGGQGFSSLSCLLPEPGIRRFNFDESDPLAILTDEVWLAGGLLSSSGGLLGGLLDLLDPGALLGLLTDPASLLELNELLELDNTLYAPYGLTREGNFLYGTDGGSVYRVEILPGGGSASQVERLFIRLTGLLGDLAISEHGLLVTDRVMGTVLLLEEVGGQLEKLEETAAELLNDPGAVVLGVPPLYTVGDLLVTELPAEPSDGEGGNGGDGGEGGEGGDEGGGSGGGLLPVLLDKTVSLLLGR